MWSRAAPRGCRFTPTDFELIQYLWDKINGCSDPGQGFINNHVDVYDTDPHLLSRGAKDGRLFCFTPIKFRKGSTRRDRSTPQGHWKAKNGKRTVKDDDGNPVGFTQNFSFCIGNRTRVFDMKRRCPNPKWIMKEYTTFGEEPHNVALCVIYSSANKYSSKPIQNLSILPSIEVDVSHIKSSQGSRSDHWISKNYSNDVSEWPGELSFVNNGGSLPVMKNGYSAAGVDTESDHDMIKNNYVTSPSVFAESLFEEVNSPQLDLKL